MGRACCGRVCETSFCPHCGREVAPNPLSGLLKHVGRRLHERRQQVKRRAEGLSRTDLTDAQRSRAEQRYRAKEALAARWQAWHDALAALMHGEDGPHGGFQSPPQDGPAT
jgi:hypothetical protein